jgi:hypothetical protein
MNIGAGSLSFSDYLVTDFGIHILFKNIYSMRMADLCVFEVLCERIDVVARACVALFESPELASSPVGSGCWAVLFDYVGF